MCNYCKIDQDFDGCYYGQMFFKEMIPCGNFLDIGIEANIVGEPNSPEIFVDIDIPDADYFSIFTKSIPINYCPICGRKLTQKIES